MYNIGIDCRFFTESATGVGRHVYELVIHLSKLDKENSYTIFLKPDEYEKFKIPSNNFKKELTKANHYSFSEQWSFFRQINKYKFDLMIFPQFNGPILYNRPFVVTIHDLTLHLFPGKKKTDILSRSAYKLVINTMTRKAKHCFAVSENTKRDMIKYLKIPDNKITVTYNGITERFQPINDKNLLEMFNKKYNLPMKYILYTGVSRSHKNIVGLIKAFSLFSKKYKNENIYLLLSGPVDPAYKEVDEEIIKQGLKDQVKHLGMFPEKDFSKLMCGSIAYVFPSFYEGFGIPPIEAMQCGIPVASSNAASLPEVCGDAAQYFDPYNINEIESAIETVVFDQTRRKDLIEKGFIQSKKFTWENMVKKMYDVYISIL